MIEELFLLFAGHFLADFPLQGDHISKTKSRHHIPDYIPKGQIATPIWFYSLTAHAMIHGLMVFLITTRMDLTLFMIITHWIIDFMKCENWTDPHADQVFHYIVLLTICGQLG